MKDPTKEHIEMARRQFAKHEIILSSVNGAIGVWSMAKRQGDDGRLCGDDSWSIAVMNRRILIQGDLGLFSFGHCNVEAIPALAWIGCHKSWDYIVEKAKIGMGKLDGVLDWSEDQVKIDLMDIALGHDDFDDCDDIKLKIANIIQQDDLSNEADILEKLSDFPDDISDEFGRRISFRCILAQAAVRRLCELLGMEVPA